MEAGKTFLGMWQIGERERQRERIRREREAALVEIGRWRGLILTVG